MKKGTQVGNNIQMDLMGENSWNFRVKLPAERLRKVNMESGKRKYVQSFDLFLSYFNDMIEIESLDLQCALFIITFSCFALRNLFFP